MSNSCLHYLSFLEDEISLEGLDGITLEALWVRLKQRSNFETSLPLDQHSKSFLWDLVRGDEEIFFYELPSPREELVIFNRYEHMDQELGMVLEPKDVPHDIYPFHPIDDDKKGIRGSCKLYKERVDVTDVVCKKTLEEVQEEYGEKLVLVSSQMLRDKALNISACIDKFYDLSLTQYILLERVGRSRQMGEITQGKVSLATLGDSPKSMFYHRKRLLKLNLITKQPHQQKGVKGQTQNGSLLHLTRFYVERRSKFVMMIQRAVEILKGKANGSAPYPVMKEEMGMPEQSCRKLFKSSEFQRYVKFVNAPYRHAYPNAPVEEWRCKGKDTEKFVRMMVLINLEIDPQDVCKAEENVDDDDEDDPYPGILDQQRLCLKVGLLHQAYEIVEAAGPDGVSQSDMARLLGQTKLDSRTICRNLQRRNAVHSLMKDMGRQRVSRYVSNKFVSTGHLTQEFRKEREKMMAMIQESRVQEKSLPLTSNEKEVTRKVETDSVEGVEVDLEMVPSITDKSGRRNMTRTNTTESQSQTSEPKKSSTVDDNLTKNKGFLSMLEDMQLTQHKQKLNSPHVTTRLMKRANMIIETVRLVKVIDDAFKLQKMIVKAEIEEGYHVRMDKKSLNRLLDRLARGGFLKNIIVKLKCGDQVKLVPYVVDPKITFESPLLIAAIEQQKLKFLGYKNNLLTKEGEGSTSSSVKESKSKAESPTKSNKDPQYDDSTMNQMSVGESMQELKQMHQIVNRKTPSVDAEQPIPSAVIEEKLKKTTPARGSLGPKFVRMCEIHKLLFYLVYGYSGQEDLDQQQCWETIAKSSPEVMLQDEDLASYPTIYCPEVSWKMFIPKLPNHIVSESGWAFVCDILLRLPLCVFVKLVSGNYVSPEVEEFLAHPLKKNFLVKHLPMSLRHTLLFGRRYVTYVLDLLNRLCYIGLTQFGHQVMKEKDQVFVFINQHASLIDTTTSSPGYHQISADKEYVRKQYTFSNMQDVNQYWYDMWTISMHTPLGGHNCMQGKKITIQILDRKPQIIESIKPRNTTEAPLRDTGSIPGDGRGACGFDSALFAHLKRNWSSNSGHSAGARPSSLIAPNVDGVEKTYEGTVSYSQYLMSTTNPSSDALSPKHRLAGLRNVKLSVYKPRLGTDGKTMEVPVGMVASQSKGRKRKKEMLETELPPPKPPRLTVSRRSKPDAYQRNVKLRKKSPKKPYYDEEDRAALRRMNKLRVDWSSAEDSFLLLCKVASCFLFPNKRSQMITFSLVRDLLHKRFPEARNKTSRACQRRINYIMKNPTTEDNVAIFLEEVRHDSKIVEDFKNPRLPKNRENLDNIYSDMFRDLMQRLVAKFASSESRQCANLPDNLDEFNKSFRIILATSSLRNKALKCKEVTTVSDIDFSVVNSLIYSSLCSYGDRQTYAYQLYLAYQQYPQSLLNAVLQQMRQDQMISYKKCYHKSPSPLAQTCLPLSTSPFQLSVTYLFAFNFKYQYEIFFQSWDMLKRMYVKEKSLLNKIIPTLKSNDPSNPHAGSSISDDGGLESEEADKGVPVVILHEGGYCAAVVALLATKRLIFDIVIPEQIIMMDHIPPQPLLEDPTNSLMRRFSSHSEMAGKEGVEHLGQVPKNVLLSQDSNSNQSPMSNDTDFDTSNEPFSLDEGAGNSKGPVKRKALGKDAGKVKKSKVSQDEPDPNKPSTSNSSADIRSKDKSEGSPTRKESSTGDKQNKPVKEKQHKQSVTFELDKINDEPENTNEVNDPVVGDVNQPVGEMSSTEGDDSEATVSSTRLASASRLGLYMMRDQLSKAEVNQINLQHAQEHLVVNACDITCRLRPPPELQDSFEIIVPEEPERIEDFLLPLTKQTISYSLDQRKEITLKDWAYLNDVLPQWKEDGKSETLIQLVREVYEYIHLCKEIGASVFELKEKFNIPGVLNITFVIHLMEEAKLLLRVGVAVVRWVTMPHTKPWLIHTNKISKDKQQAMPLKGIYQVHPENEKVEKTTSQLSEDTVAGSGTSAQGSQEMEESEAIDTQNPTPDSVAQAPTSGDLEENMTTSQETSGASDGASSNYKETGNVKRSARLKDNLLKKKNKNCNASQEGTTKRNIHSRLALTKKKYKLDEEASLDMEKSMKQYQESTDYEEISVAVRPWVRLNGTLNRRVLDRLLGAVLCHIMERPGIIGRDVVSRFSPALQPAHTHDLLETLVSLECITRGELIQSHKVSLFSDTVDYTLVPAELHDYDDNLVYEPTVDAIIKLGMFIGDKAYSKDFLSGECRSVVSRR